MLCDRSSRSETMSATRSWRSFGTQQRSSMRRRRTREGPNGVEGASEAVRVVEHQGKAGRHAPHPLRNLPRVTHNTPGRHDTQPPSTQPPNPTVNTLKHRRLSLPLPHESPLPGGRLQGATRRFAIGTRADPGPSHPLVEPWQRSGARRRTRQTRPPAKTKPPENRQFPTLSGCLATGKTAPAAPSSNWKSLLRNEKRH